MSNWTTERRAKALLIKHDNDDSGGTVATRLGHVSANPPSEDAYRTDEDYLSEEEEEERPGAYAITRDQNRIPENEWDPTDRALECSNHQGVSFREAHQQGSLCNSDQLDPVVFGNENEIEHTDDKSFFVTHRCLFFLAVALCCIASAAVFVSMLLLYGEKSRAYTGNLQNEKCSDDQLNPSIQCECKMEISIISDTTKGYYNSVKGFDALWGRLDPDMTISSCDPANIALVWVSLEYQMWEEQGIDQWEQRLTSRLALAWLYFSSSGEDWTNNSNWATTQSECTWYGISCDDQNKVIGVTLPMNGLKGPLGTWVALLPYLKKLDLTGNRLGGSIPWEISSFSKIEDLRLGNNALTGSLPSHMSGFTSLRYLHLFHNAITGTLPSQLYLLTALKELNLNSTWLSGSIPSTGWGMMRYLELLDLNSIVGLEGIFPSSLTLLTNLMTLNLGGARLVGTVPDSIGFMIALESLVLQTTSLTGNIPSSIGNLPNLKFFDVGSSSFTGTIPFELGNCTQIQDFLVNYNFLSGTIPIDLEGMTRLRTLNLAGNKISGEFPEGLSNLKTLMSVDVSSTEIKAMPSGMCSSSRTVYICPASPLFGCDCCTVPTEELKCISI